MSEIFRIEEFERRNEGCEALLIDDGRDKQIVPVCMGGVEILGCNNPDSCIERYCERTEGSSTTSMFRRDRTGLKIVAETIFDRETLSEKEKRIKSLTNK